MRALNQAAQDAVELRRRARLPPAVWRNGKVALVPADEVARQRNGSASRRRKPLKKTPEKQPRPNP